MTGTCRFCGRDSDGVDFDGWVKDTFTDFDKLLVGEIVCNDCLFFFDEKSARLTEITGKEKLQRMRNYSHFIVNGQWIPLSKGDKKRMTALLLGYPFPELAAIAESGQKHIVFRATLNPAGSRRGWVQFEEQPVFVDPDRLRELLATIERLYVGFSKSHIEIGRYPSYLILKFGVDNWIELEDKLKKERGSLLFSFAIFLAQREDRDNGQSEGPSKNAVGGDLEGRAGVVQEQVPNEHLGAVREQCSERGVHEQPVQVRQLDMFQA